MKEPSIEELREWIDNAPPGTVVGLMQETLDKLVREQEIRDAFTRTRLEFKTYHFESHLKHVFEEVPVG